MLFLTETIDPTRKLVEAETRKDEKSGQQFYYLKGIFLEGEVQNYNGRWYPLVEIEKAINQLTKKIKEIDSPIVGELDHPEGLNINFDRVAVAITEMHMNGNNGCGTMRVIPAGLGLILEGTLKAGVRVGVSRRGSGDVDRRGHVRDFDIVTIDAVINPSAHNARPEMRLAESVQRDQYGREALRLTEFVHNDPAAQKYLRNEITKFLRSIRPQAEWRK